MFKRITIDDFDLHNLATDDGLVMYKDGVSGLGEPNIRLSADDRSGEDGGLVASSLLSMLTPSFKGYIKAPDSVTYMNRRRALVQAIHQQKDSRGRPVPHRMYLVDLNDVEYFIDVYTRAYKIDTAHNHLADFLLQFIAEDPAIYVNDPKTSGLITRPAGGGVVYPVTYPAIYGASTGGIVSLYNYGTIKSWPIITLKGPATNPAIVHQELGIVMALNIVLGVNDTVKIDMRNHSIILNDATNALSYKTDESDWFYIQPEDNTISFNTGVSTDTGTMELKYYPGYEAL